jgi:hypothetical protein
VVVRGQQEIQQLLEVEGVVVVVMLWVKMLQEVQEEQEVLLGLIMGNRMGLVCQGVLAVQVLQ